MSQLRKLAALLLFLGASLSWGAISATAHWNVRTDGSNTNGGFFDASVGSPGTDYTAQAAAQIAFTDMVIGATTTQFTSVLNAATTASPGNGIYISGGTGCTVGWYEILSQSSGTYVMDRAMGTAASVCTGNLGGGLLTLQTAMTNGVANNFINLKSGTYTFTTAYTIAITGYTVVGYGATYNDGGTRPEILASGTNSLFVFNTAGAEFVNVNFTGNGTGGPGMYVSSNSGSAYLTLLNCYVASFGSSGTDGGGFIDQTNNSNDYFAAGLNVYFSEVTGNSAFINGAGSRAYSEYLVGNYFHGNATSLVAAGGQYGTFIINNIFSGSTGSYEIQLQGGQIYLFGNTFYNAGTLALSVSAPYELANNIFYGNHQAVSNSGSAPSGNYTQSTMTNAYGSNTVANTNWPTTLGTDITLTANPFVSAYTGNFQLNTTTGGGSLLIGKATPSVFPGASSTNNLSVGAVQPAASGGAVTVLVQGFAY